MRKAFDFTGVTIFKECRKVGRTQISDAEIRLIFGDFNARLHCVLDDDKPQVGSHILGRGFGFLNNVSPNTLENRELFVDFF